ncbi:HPP family protein [Oculatella sp. LEGE 06141]|uniref:HPP family protein n=1 Tax=Oculatella sp. LEGE 06141 TaxID=1828648 RepID=UPI00187E5BD2|nr:HPP family protein [Oculatella sp. LEGE 06141]MBE9182485.1 HPP family protein [Oculatella sp. LEGE 06141]
MTNQQNSTRSPSSTKRYPSWIPDIVWTPIAAGSLMLVVGLFAQVAHQPWLFPSLGPTAFLQVEKPEQSSARFYNALMGHVHGLIAGYVAVFVLGANAEPSAISSGQLTTVRLWASVLGVALNMFTGFLLKASHPPAAATTLLVTLGSFKSTALDGATVLLGVVVSTTLGEVLRRIRLGQKLWPLGRTD